jgi:hypothetical protein
MANAFELRTRMIEQAKDLLLNDYHQKMEISREKARLTSTAPDYVEPPTSAEILKLAQELYSFVSTPA